MSLNIASSSKSREAVLNVLVEISIFKVENFLKVISSNSKRYPVAVKKSGM